MGIILPVKAQNVTTPYSMYGYGILSDHATSMQRQMGGVGYALASGRQINVMNPASYAAVDSLTFLFDIGADVSMLWSKEKNLKDNSVGGGLDYLTMQFPISRNFGGSIGLLPYSSVGYAFGNDIFHGSMSNQGTGGINQAYLGFAGTIKGFSLGFNVSYNFGNIRNDVYSTPENGGEMLTEHVMQIRDWDVNIGAQYMFYINKDDRFTFGFTYSPKKSLNGKTWVTTQETTQETAGETIASLRLKDNYYSPNNFGAGINYTHVKASRFIAEFDVTFQEWSKAKYSALYSIANPNEIVFEGMKFNDRLKFAVGCEYVPKLRGSYAQRMAYRVGGYYCNDYLNIQGNRIREYGVSCGVGLHTPQDKTMINVGLEWKHRQAHPNPLIRENYFNVTLGVNFNELWFYQRKIK
ncbi:MAG: hypothetical protein K2N03_00615 [Muribaculaceae bacterium]|nr:hypothetical protein [Muribaculaceae bacterium]